MDGDLTFAPFRPFDDFIGNGNNFSIPNFGDLERLNNRITNNLLYYQTNYLVVLILVCVIVGVMNPAQFTMGLVTILALFIGFVYIKNNNSQVQRLLRDKPYLNLVILTVGAGFIINVFGSILVFLFSICMPLTLIFIHAALRLRNLKNKVVNKIEFIGFKRTPMGYLLEQLGATNEAAS